MLMDHMMSEVDFNASTTKNYAENFTILTFFKWLRILWITTLLYLRIVQPVCQQTKVYNSVRFVLMYSPILVIQTVNFH